MQTFLDGSLPDNKTIVDTMSRKAFEVESIEETGDDSLFEIKVLPNRVADAFSLSGMAKELSALFDLKVKPPVATQDLLKDYKQKNEYVEIIEQADEGKVKLRMNKPVLVFTGLKVKFDNSVETPEWIKDILIKSGGRSINLLVDVTNLILFSFGQPAHVFDFEKLQGKIITRFAKDGEELELLDGKKVKLNTSDYVIADEGRALSLAGIKGGKSAEVDKNTKVGFFEMANFNPTMIRKTSQRLGIRTDASKIFENGISTTVTNNALAILIATLKELDPKCEIEFIVQKNMVVKKGYKVGVKLENVNSYAGREFSFEEVKKLLDKQNFQSEHIVVKDKLKQEIDELLVLQKSNKSEYKMGASVIGDAPRYFDCSGLVSYLYKEAGIQIPRLSIDQLTFGKKVEKKDLIFGDLVFINGNKGHIWYESLEYKKGTKFERGVDHVGMYLGDDKVLHISRSDNEIQIVDLKEGKKFTEDVIVAYARMCNIEEKRVVVTPPDERLDIKMEEDVLEEILRIYGFDNIESTPVEIIKNVHHNTRFLLENYLKVKLMNLGYTEVFSYAFGDKGTVKVKMGLASDKENLRDNLFLNAQSTFTKNYNYLPVLQSEILKFFEIGTVFQSVEEEEKRMIIVCDDNKKKTKYLADLENILAEIEKELGISKVELIQKSEKPAMLEFSLNKIVKELDEKKIAVPFVSTNVNLQSIKYKPLSIYPFIVRDTACFVPDSASFDFESLKKQIEDLKLQHLEKVYMFDKFEKEGKLSIAFRIIFQSYERTLTDVEVEQEMGKVTVLLQNSGFTIR